MIYIASPYTHTDMAVVEDRASMACSFAVRCAKLGHVVYSPIAAWHHIQAERGMPSTWAFWRKIDIGILRHCDEMWVLRLKDWKESRGVREEIELAVSLGIEIRYFDFGDIP